MFPVPPSAETRPHLSVLLADLDDALAKTVDGILETLGYSHSIGSVDDISASADTDSPPDSETTPDIIIVHGHQAVDAVLRRRPSAQVVALVDEGDHAENGECLRAGASGTAPLPADGTILGLVLDNVSEKVLLKRQLHSEVFKARRKYEDLFNQVPCYITIQDRNLRIVEANERFRRHFGFDRGIHCYEAYKNRCEECDNCPVRRTFEDGDPHQNEAVVTARTGQTYNILVWTAPVFNEEGDVEHVLEVSTNITTVRRLQDQLTNMGMMLGSMAHGVKGMLAALDAGSHRIDAGLERNDPGRVEKGWKVVKHRLGHLKKMVLDTLYYAKSRELERTPLTLGEFADDIAMLARPKGVAAGVQINCRFEDRDRVFLADPDALSPALVNFLENSIDACLYDRSKPDHRVEFSVFIRDNIVHFEICDNGIGMDKETQEKMFTLFFSSKGANGTGIGLFISNQVIERHGGSIKVDSTPGEGTCFRILLPAAVPAGAELPATQEQLAGQDD